jgi:hypothetical protein
MPSIAIGQIIGAVVEILTACRLRILVSNHTSKALGFPGLAKLSILPDSWVNLDEYQLQLKCRLFTFPTLRKK